MLESLQALLLAAFVQRRLFLRRNQIGPGQRSVTRPAKSGKYRATTTHSEDALTLAYRETRQQRRAAQRREWSGYSRSIFDSSRYWRKYA